MKVKPFKVEQWMNAYETGAKYNIAETCVDSVSMDELFALTGQEPAAFWADFGARRLTYGHIEGAPAFREGGSSLYKTVRPEQVVPTHGAAGANHHVFYSLVEPGDRVVSVMPTYQQLYSIPEGYGADMRILHLEPEKGYLPDLEQLARLAVPGTKLICINNPNNPTGALMDEATLRAIADIADRAGAYVLCDEVYRHLTQDDEYSPSMADLYDRGISVGSMSKVFSLAGLRLGWIACRDGAALDAFWSHRDYDHISCGMFDEAAAALALAHKDAVLARSRSIIRDNLAVLDAWVRAEPHVWYVRPRAGTTALIHYDFDIPSHDFCQRMYHATGAFVTPGDCFGESRCMRVGYASSRRTLREGLAAVSAFMRTLEKEDTPTCLN